MNKYPNLNTDNPFAAQSKLFVHLDRIYEYWIVGDTDPVFIEINLTNQCNLKCSWCISGNFKHNDNELEIGALSKFIEEFKDQGGKAITFSGGGEPTLYSQFTEATKQARNNDLELGLMTNGAFDPLLISTIADNFKWLRISLDTLNPQYYKKWKGINRLDHVLSNINVLANTDIKLGINVNVSPKHTVVDVSNTIDKLYDKVSYIQFRPILPRYYEKEKVKINEVVWEYLSRFEDDLKINLSLDKLKDLHNENLFPFAKCVGHKLNPVLDANGDLMVCMYHPRDPNFIMGNIYKNTLDEIWESDKRKEVEEFLATLDYSENCQICCKLTELNKFFTFLDNANTLEDKNFL